MEIRIVKEAEWGRALHGRETRQDERISYQHPESLNQQRDQAHAQRPHDTAPYVAKVNETPG
jgi:hypothetical protein